MNKQRDERKARAEKVLAAVTAEEKRIAANRVGREALKAVRLSDQQDAAKKLPELEAAVTKYGKIEDDACGIYATARYDHRRAKETLRKQRVLAGLPAREKPAAEATAPAEVE